MAVACGNTVLSGSSGSVAVTPAGTAVCLSDYTDFPAGDNITLPEGTGFLVGDQVTFTVEAPGVLDSALTAGTAYYVIALTSTTMQVAATAGGTAITLQGDGGTGSADTAGHINLKLSDFTSVCNVTAFDLSLDREQIETTSLNCACDSAGGGGLAPFKTYQPGFIDGTGSMTVQFTEDQTTMASRLLKSSLMNNQDGAQIRLYINTVCTAGEVDNTKSAYIEAPVSILGFSFAVSPDEVTTATVNFALSGQPTAFSI